MRGEKKGLLKILETKGVKCFWIGKIWKNILKEKFIGESNALVNSAWLLYMLGSVLLMHVLSQQVKVFCSPSRKYDLLIL